MKLWCVLPIVVLVSPGVYFDSPVPPEQAFKPLREYVQLSSEEWRSPEPAVPEPTGVSWFLWSTVHPGYETRDSDSRTHVVKQYPNQAACEKELPEYRREVDKAFPWPKLEPNKSTWVTWTIVELKCSPVHPG